MKSNREATDMDDDRERERADCIRLSMVAAAATADWLASSSTYFRPVILSIE